VILTLLLHLASFSISPAAETATICAPNSEPLEQKVRANCAAVLRAVETSDRKSAWSYSSLILDSKRDGFMSVALGTRCVSFLRKLYVGGGTLESQVLKSAAKVISKVPFKSGVRDTSFYHWTNAKTLHASLHPEIQDASRAYQVASSERVFDQIHDFIRNREVDRSTIPEIPKETDLPLWITAFYMAEDPTSSRSYGDLRIRFDFDPSAVVVEEIGGHWDGAHQELFRKYPGLSTACPIPGYPEGTDKRGHGLYFLIAEDSGIDLIDYSNANWVGPHAWFQVIRFDKVRGVQASPPAP
jgi:hypothetical protein